MRIDPSLKYQPFEPISLPDRRWPSQVLTKPPTWCSVDLRDGNQALADPMGAERKGVLFTELVAIGFKEIEVGFPSASRTEYDFIRHLIENDRIPDDVTIQVLTPAREDHIRRTFESLHGCRRAIVHLYNSTSTIQRRVVFKSDREGITSLATEATRLIAQLARLSDTDIVLEYSPESFTGTELDFAKDICESVMEAWQPTEGRKVILNLPATVEMATPNVYADQIEWFAGNIRGRETAILSLHPHNDRGTAVAAAELALMAGADRIEGTLFGNGERTGNVDLITLALNMFTQGINPELDFSDIKRVVEVAERCTRMPVHARHPYAGELVFAAFSGSHQDAISKGLAAYAASNSKQWEVPYLPIDPKDVGRAYEPVIRINSQSGKGGVSFVLEQHYGVRLPPAHQIEFSKVVQADAERRGEELSAPQIWNLFETEYVLRSDVTSLQAYTCQPKSSLAVALAAHVKIYGKVCEVDGMGTSAVDAYRNAIARAADFKFDIVNCCTGQRTVDADSTAAFVEVQTMDGRRFFGVGLHENAVTAQLLAVDSAVNRAFSTARNAEECVQ